jgi:PAS domain S-box-containing protein
MNTLVPAQVQAKESTGHGKAEGKAAQKPRPKCNLTEALYTSGEEFRSIFDESPIGIELYDSDGLLIDANQACLDMFGVSDILQVKGFKLFEDPNLPDEAKAKLRRGKPVRYETPFDFEKVKELRLYETSKSGIIHLDVQITPMGEKQKDASEGYLVQVQDITERKRAEKVQASVYRISQAAVSTESLEELFDTIHNILGELMPVENFYISLYDPASDLISFPYFVDQYDQPPPPQKPGRGLTEYVLRSGQPLLASPDIFAQLAKQGKVDARGTDSVDWLGVPLIVEERVIGVMVTQSYTEGVRFSQDETDMLEFVSAQAAQAIERKRAEEEIKQHNQELASLNRASQAITSSLDIRKVLDQIVDLTGSLVNAAYTSIVLIEEDGSLGISAENFQEGPPLGSRARPQGITRQIIASQQPLVFDDVSNDGTHNPAVVAAGVRSYAGLPVSVKGKVLGVLFVHSHTPGAFHDRLPLLTTFANQAAIAIENARLYTSLGNEKQRLELLYNLSHHLTESLDSHQVATKALDHICTALGAFKGVIYVPRPDNDRWDLLASSGMKPAELEAFNQYAGLPLPSGLTGWAASHKKTAIVPDVAKDKRWETIPGLDKWARSAMSTPLLAGNTIVGVLNLLSDHIAAFREEDVEIVKAAAASVAVALQNARLYAAEKRRAERLSILNHIARALSTTLKLDELLEVVQQEITAVLEADAFFIALYDREADELDFRIRMDKDVREPPERRPMAPGLTASVVTSKQPLLIRDFEREKDHLPPVKLWGTMEAPQSWLGVPVLLGQEVVGVISVQAYRPNIYGETEQQLFSTIAGAVAVAIENARLYEAEQRRAVRLAGISRIDIEIAALHEASAVLNILVARAAALMESATCTVMLIDTATNEVVLAAQTGLPEGTSPELRVPLELPILRHSVETSQPIILPDINHDAPAIRAVLGRPDIRAFFAYPMIRAGRTIGFITFSKLTLHTPSAEEIAACQLLAERAAVALENARLFEETARSLRQVQALRTIDMTIASSFDLRLTLNIFLDQTRTQLGVDAVEILVYNPHTQMLDYAAGIGFRTTALQGTHMRLGQGYAGIAGLERKTIRVSNLREHKTDFLRSPNFKAEEFDTYFGVPLIAKGQVKGVLEVFHRSPLQPDQNWMDFMETLGKQAAIGIDNATLFSDLQSSNAELMLAYDTTLSGWSKALDLRDRETEGHTQRVVETTVKLARAMGISEAELADVRRGALLHDIGKMGVPDDILHKPGPLTVEDWAIMRQHPVYAHELLSPITYLRPAMDIPYYHHEKWDGSGYPNGLKGEQIPLAARVFAVVDVFDALSSDRPYRSAWPREEALEYIREQAGKHFDPKIVEVFIKMQ